MPYRPDVEERTKALDDLHYEIFQLLIAIQPRTGATPFDNAILESRLLHVRNLIDFFNESSANQDDVLAAHYGFVGKRVNLDPAYVLRLNKDLSHLTYSRIRRTPSEKGWPVDAVVVPILEGGDHFIDHLPKTRDVFADVGPTEWRVLQGKVRDAARSLCRRPGV